MNNPRRELMFFKNLSAAVAAATMIMMVALSAQLLYLFVVNPTLLDNTPEMVQTSLAIHYAVFQLILISLVIYSLRFEDIPFTILLLALALLPLITEITLVWMGHNFLDMFALSDYRVWLIRIGSAFGVTYELIKRLRKSGARGCLQAA